MTQTQDLDTLRAVAEGAAKVWDTDCEIGGAVDTFTDTFTAPVVLALLSRLDRYEKALIETRRLVAACAENGFTEAEPVEALFRNQAAICTALQTQEDSRG